MNKPFYNVIKNEATKTARINIYGEISSYYWDENNAKRFVRDFTILENSFDRIDVHINSNGGSVWEGLAIFNAIRASSKDIHTYNDGIAFSMGAIILLAGHTVHAAKGSLLMLHNTSGMAWGNAAEMKKIAAVLEKHDEVLSQLIADKTGRTVEQVNSLWMNMEDNFLTASEASAFKLVDVLESYNAENVPEGAENMTAHKVAAHFKSSNQNSKMDISKIKALANAAANSQDVLDAANAELTTAGITNFTIVEESVITAGETATKENERLTGELATSNTAKAKAETDLATANTAKEKAEADLATANTKITELEAKLAAKPGASHKPAAATADPTITTEEDQDVEAALAAMPHNKAADGII